MKLAFIRILKDIHYCNASMTRIQRRVYNHITKEECWLSFNKGSKLFSKFYNRTSTGQNVFISYNDQERNNVRIMTDKQYVKFSNEFIEYLI